jgi:hypothetical protein
MPKPFLSTSRGLPGGRRPRRDALRLLLLTLAVLTAIPGLGVPGAGGADPRADIGHAIRPEDGTHARSTAQPVREHEQPAQPAAPVGWGWG